MKFYCPDCGNDQLECIQVNAVVCTPIDVDDGEVIYKEAEIHDGDVDRYQCRNCGWTIPGVTTDEELLEWIKTENQLVVQEDRSVCDTVNDQVLYGCECDNTHQQNDVVCRFCWAHGRRKWNDPEVPDAECGHSNAVLSDADDPPTYHCPDCGLNFIGSK